MNQWNTNSGWILRIKSKSGFLRFTIWSVFLGGGRGGKELKKSIFDKRFQKKNGTQRMPHMSVNLCWSRLINFELHIIPCLLSIQIIGRLFLNPFLSCFLYVCLRRFIFQVIKKKLSASVLNSYNLSTLRSVLCFKPKYIHFVYSFVTYVAFSCCLRREDQFVVFFFPRGAREHAYPLSW